MAIVGGSRRYPTHTKLGALMYERGLWASTVCRATGIYPRTMTEYLAGRKQPSRGNHIKLCEYFDVPIEDLVGLADVDPLPIVKREDAINPDTTPVWPQTPVRVVSPPKQLDPQGLRRYETFLETGKKPDLRGYR